MATFSQTSATSLKVQVSQLLTQYADLTKTLFESTEALAKGSLSSGIQQTPEEVTRQIIKVDEELQRAVEKIEEHQARQHKIMQVQQSIRVHNVAILQLVNRLQDAKEMLEARLDGAARETTAIKQARESKTSFTDLISYAAKLSKFTSAPPNFDPMAFNPLMEKPYPEEIRMRQGILYQGRVIALEGIPMEIDDSRKLDDEISETEEEKPRGYAELIGVASGIGNAPVTEEKHEMLNFALN